MLTRQKLVVQKIYYNSAEMPVALVLMHAITLLSQSHHLVRESDARGVRVSFLGESKSFEQFAR